jgi:hypothetical protein
MRGDAAGETTDDRRSVDPGEIDAGERKEKAAAPVWDGGLLVAGRCGGYDSQLRPARPKWP